jgi:SNF2 family DNA or RNA helicase
MLLEAVAPITIDKELHQNGDDTQHNGMSIGDVQTSSSKINELIRLLRILPLADKTLICSQFTSFLDIIQYQLQVEG